MVNDGGNKYVFNNGTTYDANTRYGLRHSSTYTLKNVSVTHPITAIGGGITLTGSSPPLMKMVDGQMYTFFSGDVTLMVSVAFAKGSVNCHYHGYMGGEHVLQYDAGC